MPTHKLVPIDLLDPAPWNYNVQSNEVFQKLSASMRRFGFVEPVVVRQVGDRYQIIGGEHRWHAAQGLGMKEIPVVDLGSLPDEKAKQLTVVLNELTGTPDKVRLADLLRDLSKSGPLVDILSVMPYSDSELQVLLETVSASTAKLPNGDVRLARPTELEVEVETVASPSRVVDFVLEMDPPRADKLLRDLHKIAKDPVAAMEKATDRYLGVKP